MRTNVSPWKKPCIRWGRDPPRDGAILGVVLPTQKQLAVYAVVIGANGRDHSIVSNGMQQKKGSFSTPGKQKHRLLPDRYHIKLPQPWKIRPSDAAFRQNSLTNCFFFWNRRILIILAYIDRRII